MCDVNCHVGELSRFQWRNLPKQAEFNIVIGGNYRAVTRKREDKPEDKESVRNVVQNYLICFVIFKF